MINIDQIKETIIGMAKKDAGDVLEGISSQVVKYRFIAHDEFILTMDHDMERVNVRLDPNGIVDQVWLG